MNKVTVRVPATSANCGPGFDTLGLACTFYNELTYEIIDTRGFYLDVTGEGADYLIPCGRNLAFAGFLKVWNLATDYQQIGLKVTMHNRIPMSRGLGSSSSAIVAGLYAANILCGNKFTKEELLQFATDIEGHPDNVAPALLGGFTISFMEGREAHSLRLLPAKPLKFIAVVPERRLPTTLARKAIPATVPHHDAVYNTSRASLLVGALLSGKYEYLSSGLEDKLHQPYRAHLIPGLADVLADGKAAGAYNVIISGAGSTIMAYADVDADCEKIAQAMQEALRKHGEESTYHVLDLDIDGVKEI